MIATTGTAAVKLSRVHGTHALDAATACKRGYGSMKGQFEVPDAFFEPLPEAELEAWERQKNLRRNKSEITLSLAISG